VRPSLAAESKGQQNKYCKQKIEFLVSTIFKLLRPVTGNSINAIFKKFISSVRGGYSSYAPQAPKNLATPVSAANGQ
jgi:hypothetical protein